MDLCVAHNSNSRLSCSEHRSHFRDLKLVSLIVLQVVDWGIALELPKINAFFFQPKGSIVLKNILKM